MNVDYAKVEMFATLYCEFQRLGRGDSFATASEMESIKTDIFAWSPLWFPALVESLGYDKHNSCELYVDHNKKVVIVRN